MAPIVPRAGAPSASLTGRRDVIKLGGTGNTVGIQVDFSEIAQLRRLFGGNGTLSRSANGAMVRALTRSAGEISRKLQKNTNDPKFINRRSGRNLLFRSKLIVPYSKKIGKDRSHITKGKAGIINRFQSKMTSSVEITPLKGLRKNFVAVQIGWDVEGNADLKYIGHLISGTKFALPRDVLTLSLDESEDKLRKIFIKEVLEITKRGASSPFAIGGVAVGGFLGSGRAGLSTTGLLAAQGVGDFISGV